MRRNILAAALLAAIGSMSVSVNAHAGAGDTTLGGKMYVDFTNLDQKDSGTKTTASGTGLDVKRFYLSTTHQFDDIWSVNLTTDFNYSSSDGETQLFVKKAYVQGKFSKAFVFRAGSADMPWIPFVEHWYGYRYVENTITDRLHYANSADWGLNLNGSVPGSGIGYSVSMVNGGGYKHPNRSKDVDFEGRIGWQPMPGLIFAVGGYTGKLGKNLQGVPTNHSADRFDGMAAYASKSLRVGVEYFSANNWSNVTTSYKDKADGYSVWGSVAVSDGIDIFARYDYSKLSKDIDPKSKDKYYNVGVQFQVTKGFVLSAVYKHDQQDGNVLLSSPISIPVGFHPDRSSDEIGLWGQVAF